MKKLIFMNSAMMPSDGIYEKKSVSINELKNFIKYFDSYESYIGYQNTLEILKKEFGIDLQLSREQVFFKEENFIIAIQLKYRILTPEEKLKNLHGNSIEDYNFSIVKFYPSEDFAIYLQELKIKK